MAERKQKPLGDLTKGTECAILFGSLGGRRSAHAASEGEGDGFPIFGVPHFAEGRRFSGLEAAWGREPSGPECPQKSI